MSCETQCCVLSRGELYIADAESCDMGDLFCDTVGSGMRKLGNVLSCRIENIVEIIGTENEFIKTDDICNRISVMSSSIFLSLGCASKENFLLALGDEAVQSESNPKTDKFCVSEFKKCTFFPFSKKGALLTSEDIEVDVLDVDGQVLETLVYDEDFKASKSGIELLKDLEITGGFELKVRYDYNSAEFTEINFAKVLQGHKSLYFKGVNYSNGEGLFDAEFKRVLFKPSAGFDLISQGDFFTLELDGIVEKKDNEFYKIIKQES